MTVREWVVSAESRLSDSGFEASSLEAQLLAAHVLLVDRVWLMAHPDEPFPELAGESVLAVRLSHRPLAYILGYREFYGRRFSVRPGVLIPRQDTEVLIEAALRWANDKLPLSPTVLDLGTGSGCVGITLKLERPNWEVTLSDVSAEALEIATQNSEDLGATVRLIESDGFGAMTGDRFDLIVTNPPYIGLAEPLDREVADFEPHIALYAGATGMEFYERMARESKGHLMTGGILAMEVGYRQAESVARLFESMGWKVGEVVEDLQKIARVVVCIK